MFRIHMGVRYVSCAHILLCYSYLVIYHVDWLYIYWHSVLRLARSLNIQFTGNLIKRNLSSSHPKLSSNWKSISLFYYIFFFSLLFIILSFVFFMLDIFYCRQNKPMSLCRTLAPTCYQSLFKSHQIVRIKSNDSLGRLNNYGLV